MRPRNLACALAVVWVSLVPASAAWAGGGGAPPPAPQCSTGVADNFDRPFGTDLGPNWTELDEDYVIDGAQRLSLATGKEQGTTLFNGVTATDTCVDLLHPNASPGLDNGGLLLNYAGPGNFLMIEAERDHDAGFNKLLIFQGQTQILDQEMSAFGSLSSLRLHAYLDQDAAGVHRVNVGVDVQPDGTDEFSYSAVYDPSHASGNRIGLTSDGKVSLNDFRISNPVTLEGGNGTLGTGGKDVTKPVLGRLGLSRSVFAAASSGASTVSKHKRTPVGTKVSFSVSERSSVRFAVQRKAKGRKSGSRCAKPTRRNRKKKRCTRWPSVRGSFTVPAKQGSNTFTFRGRIGGTRLKPGRYRLVGRAVDGAKNPSATRTVTFRIARR
jgi:hypothetical protein